VSVPSDFAAQLQAPEVDALSPAVVKQHKAPAGLPALGGLKNTHIHLVPPNDVFCEIARQVRPPVEEPTLIEVRLERRE